MRAALPGARLVVTVGLRSVDRGAVRVRLWADDVDEENQKTLLEHLK